MHHAYHEVCKFSGNTPSTSATFRVSNDGRIPCRELMGESVGSPEVRPQTPGFAQTTNLLTNGRSCSS